MSPVRAEVVVDLAAIRHNVRQLRAQADPAQLMVVVKADGYGHGMVPVARAAREAGASWLGVATLDEALALRESGDTGPLLCWLTVPGEEYAAALAADVEVTAYSTDELAGIREAARGLGRPARLQLKVDTGLTRGGAGAGEWPALVRAAREAERAGEVTVTGVWSHVATGDEPDNPANDAQQEAFEDALTVAYEAGLRPGLRHLANSATALLRPGARYDLVRCGIAAYGLDPAPGVTAARLPGLALRPAMTVRARLALVKPVAAGASVSYGHTWTAPQDTTLGLLPVGYGDGVPRHASSVVDTWVAGERRPLVGRVCMDQVMIDLAGTQPPPGDWVGLFGAGHDGAPTATEWAQACGTINYEIVTRMGGRTVRRYEDTAPEQAVPEQVRELRR